MSDPTRLLEAAAAGDRQAAAELLPLVYEELRQLAAAKIAMEKAGHTLNPTALVHEAYLRLVGGPSFDGLGHFFAVLIRYAGQHAQHMHKALEEMNVKLPEVVSDITGATGMGIQRPSARLPPTRAAGVGANERPGLGGGVGLRSSQQCFVAGGREDNARTHGLDSRLRVARRNRSKDGHWQASAFGGPG
jgi:hypothetical protein